MIVLALALLLTGPIVGPGPCNSDTPWGCYAFRVWLPMVKG